MYDMLHLNLFMENTANKRIPWYIDVASLFESTHAKMKTNVKCSRCSITMDRDYNGARNICLKYLSNLL